MTDSTPHSKEVEDALDVIQRRAADRPGYARAVLQLARTQITDPFTIVTAGDKIETIAYRGNASPSELGTKQIQLLAIHIQAVTESLDNDVRYGDTATLALQQLEQLHTDGYTVSMEVDEGP